MPPPSLSRVISAVVFLFSVKHVFAALRIGISRDVKCALVRVAEAQHYFKKQGVEVVVKEYDSGASAVSDLVADKVDVAAAAEFVFVLQSSKHQDVRIPATIGMSSDNDLIVRKDRGILRPQDLKGKRVAITRGTSAKFFFHNYLILNRVPLASIQVVHQPPSRITKVMVDGTVDAALCWPPYTIDMEKQLGSKVARWPAQSGQDYYFALVSKEGFAKNRSNVMECFLAALSEAEEFVAKYPDRARTILSDELKTSADSLFLQWSRSRFKLQLTQDLLVLMEREAKWAIRRKLVEKKETPNYLDFFYFDAIDKAKPHGVTSVH